MRAAIEVGDLSFSFGNRLALDRVTFQVPAESLFAIVGPNGGGKSTLFRILATLARPSAGTAQIFGVDVLRAPSEVRRRIGVVFQNPALDKKLTALENLLYQGALYGLLRGETRERAEQLLRRLGIFERRNDRVETLSGGLKRRVEIAKGLLHRPQLLLLDEPTTGLDPLARREVAQYLDELKAADGLTVVQTTHLLEEADHCDGVAFLNAGRIVAADRPAALKERLGGDVISLRSRAPEGLRAKIEERFHLTAKVIGDSVRIERKSGHEFIPALVAAFSDLIESVTLGKPTLEDFFIQQTGHSYDRPLAGDVR